MKITHAAFAQPLRSWLRNKSLNTTISNQIQMKNATNISRSTKTWPDPKSSASTMFHLDVIRIRPGEADSANPRVSVGVGQATPLGVATPLPVTSGRTAPRARRASRTCRRGT